MERCFILQVLTLASMSMSMLVTTSAATDRPSYRNDPPIIGGKLVKPIDAGWQVAIIYKRRLICGGTLLDDSVVLTSAGCVKDIEPANMHVRAGTTNFKNGGQVRKILETVHHPLYDEDTLAYDVALMQLIKPFNATESHMRLIELPEETKHAELPSTVTVYGWGTTGRRAERNTTMTRNIRNSKVKIYSSKRCAQFLNDRKLSDMFFCAGDRMQHVDVCNDDLGGPAFSEHDVQIGIVSESSGCTGARHTTVFTKTLVHKAWIEQTLAEMKAAPTVKPDPKTKRRG